jgi:hypothetical protein
VFVLSQKKPETSTAKTSIKPAGNLKTPILALLAVQLIAVLIFQIIAHTNHHNAFLKLAAFVLTLKKPIFAPKPLQLIPIKCNVMPMSIALMVNVRK